LVIQFYKCLQCWIIVIVLSKSFKKKILNSYENFEDPGNLAYLMSGHDLSKEMYHLLIHNDFGYYLYMDLGSLLFSDDLDYEPDVPKLQLKIKLIYIMR
jgi:hypothetical protein